jgi:hypothetical protein
MLDLENMNDEHLEQLRKRYESLTKKTQKMQENADG